MNAYRRFVVAMNLEPPLACEAFRELDTID